jgi:hypothetical protein
MEYTIDIHKLNRQELISLMHQAYEEMAKTTLLSGNVPTHTKWELSSKSYQLVFDNPKNDIDAHRRRIFSEHINSAIREYRLYLQTVISQIVPEVQLNGHVDKPSETPLKGELNDDTN